MEPYDYQVRELSLSDIPYIVNNNYYQSKKINGTGVNVYIRPEGMTVKSRTTTTFYEEPKSTTEQFFRGEFVKIYDAKGIPAGYKIYIHTGEVTTVTYPTIIEKSKQLVTLDNLLLTHEIWEDNLHDGYIFTPFDIQTNLIDRSKPIFRVKYQPTIEVEFDGTYWSIEGGIALNRPVKASKNLDRGIYELIFQNDGYGGNPCLSVRCKRDDKEKPNSEAYVRNFKNVMRYSTLRNTLYNFHFFKQACQKERETILKLYKGNILDIGSGDGSGIRHMKHYNEIYMVEKNVTLEDQIRENCCFINKPINIYMKDVKSLTFFGKRFDVISLLFSLTLFDNYDHLQKLIRDNLKKGGVVIVLTMIYREDYLERINFIRKTDHNSVDINIAGIEQTEHIVNVEKLIQSFGEAGTKMIRHWTLGETGFLLPYERRILSYYEGFVFQKE